MASAIVDAAESSGGRLVFGEQFFGREVERLTQDGRFGILKDSAEVIERDGQGEKLTEGIPAQVVFCLELLNMFRSRSSGASLEESAPLHQGNNRKHLCARPHLEDGEEVGKVISENVAGNRNGVFTLSDSFQRKLSGFKRSQHAKIETIGIVIIEILIDLFNELSVVGSRVVEPEHGGPTRCPCSVDGKFDPVPNGGVFGLATSPEITRFHLMLDQGRALLGDDANLAIVRGLEGFVMGPVFLRLLRHQSHVGDGSHGGRIERAVLAAKVNGGLIDRGVGTVWDDGQGVLLFALGIPHLAGGADHGRHGGVDDDIAGNVEIGDSLIGVHHGQVRAVLEGRVDVGLDFGLFLRRQRIQARQEVAKPVAKIDP